MATTLLLTSCGGNSKTSETTKTPTETSKVEKILLFENETELEKTYDELAKMPNLAGKDFSFFQHVYFYADGRMKVAIQDPNNAENIDDYEYNNEKWLDPMLVQITGNGDVSANISPFTKEIFTTALVIAENWKEKQKEVEGGMRSFLIYTLQYSELAAQNWFGQPMKSMDQ